MEGGFGWQQWNINATTGTINTNRPVLPLLGGGISAPSTALAGDPGNDVWYYPTGALPNSALRPQNS